MGRFFIIGAIGRLSNPANLPALLLYKCHPFKINS